MTHYQDLLIFDNFFYFLLNEEPGVLKSMYFYLDQIKWLTKKILSKYNEENTKYNNYTVRNNVQKSSKYKSCLLNFCLKYLVTE